MQPYTEIDRQKSADKINDPVASGEAQAGRAVNAAGGSGNMNTTWTIAGQLPKIHRNIHSTFINSYRLVRVLTLCSKEVTSCFLLAQQSLPAPHPCPTQVPYSLSPREHVVARRQGRCTT